MMRFPVARASRRSFPLRLAPPVLFPRTSVDVTDKAIFTVPSQRRRNADLYPLLYPDGNPRFRGGARPGQDPTVLNLAYRETHRLPDVAGEEKVAWAAGIQRVDLTETGIRT